MTEHVVEQIDNFYWASGAREVDSEAADNITDVTDDGNALYQGDDLTQDDIISKLPTRWDTSADRSHSTSHDDEVTQDDYLTALTRLQSLSARRLTLQQKLNTSQTLLSLLELYRKPIENIQPNLVWRDSPLTPELMKLRTLAIRVAGRVGEQIRDVQVLATAEEEDEDVVMGGDEEKLKVDNVLASW